MAVKVFKVGLALLAAIALYGCGGFERVSSPSAAEAPAVAAAETSDTVSADAIAGFEARFAARAAFSIKNTGTSVRWAYAYITSFDNQTQALASKTLLVNPGATWTNTFNATCVQLDLSTQGVGGRPDIGFAIFDKQGAIITPANRDAKIAECRRPAPSPSPTPQVCRDPVSGAVVPCACDVLPQGQCPN